MQSKRCAEVFLRDAEINGVLVTSSIVEPSDKDYLQLELTRAFKACRIDTILEVQDCVIKAVESWEKSGIRVPQRFLKHLLDSLPKENIDAC